MGGIAGVADALASVSFVSPNANMLYSSALSVNWLARTCRAKRSSRAMGGHVVLGDVTFTSPVTEPGWAAVLLRRFGFLRGQ